MQLRFPVSILAVAVLPMASLAQTERPQVRSFAEVAAASFDEWDSNDDGTLSPDELDHLVVSAKYKGETAAALAAMKLVVRSTKVKPPELTLDFVTKHSKEPAGELLPSEQPREPEPKAPEARKPAPASTRPAASLERRYQSALRKIRSVKTDLFADGDPDIESCRQGPLGSCFFVAGVGAFVHRDSEAVKKMIRPETTESGDLVYHVTFGDGKAVTVPALTDAQYGLTSSAGRDGLWLAVLEQAYGALRMKSRPEARQTLEASDALAKGGSLGTTLRALTGRAIDRTRLRANADKDPELEAKVLSALKAAMKDRRLAGASTGSTTPLPPGINGKHAYAILGFDEGSRLLTLWNPHGNAFHPKGEPGRERGYETKGGVFQMPLADFIAVFESMVVESASVPDRGNGG